MCNWTIDWGDAPGWVGAVGTVLALAWAVFLYSRSLADQRKAQARLLAPIGGAAPTQVLPGQMMLGSSTAMDGLVDLIPGTGFRFIAEAWSANVRVVSTSDEAFSGVRITLVTPTGRGIHFPAGFSEIGPRELKEHTVYYPNGVIDGAMKVKLTFQDANGRWWVRFNGEPVRQMSRRAAREMTQFQRSGDYISATGKRSKSAWSLR